ncbi:MAG: DGQHR domain-containing protein [Verrucomicrobiota bacterium]|jgi:DGQHR domain-containing protein
MKLPIMPFEQPAGMFYLTSMPASELMRISIANPRKYDPVTMQTTGWIQREKSMPRVREIAEYADGIDAAFPTAVLLALKSENYTLNENETEITIEGNQVANIVDGQHRIEGLKLSKNSSAFQMPVVLMLDATIEQQALIFATINGKQTKVPSSLIYELFDVTTTRSPQKSAHEVARAMNSTDSSPWYKRLKMLGRKTPGSNESLSQGTFVKFLLPQISDDPTTDRDSIISGKELPERPKCIFNEYWRKSEDDVVLKILMNTFQGARNVWKQEWDDPNNFVLTKTNGFTGIMKALPAMFRKGKERQDLSADFFTHIFTNTRTIMQQRGITLTKEYFQTSAVGETQFRNLIIEGLQQAN